MSKIIAYKGFDENWKCRGFQFEVGKTYTHDGDVSLCNSGFHACESPFDIWSYYSPTGKAAVVELDGVSEKKDSDSKRVGKTITIKSALDIAGLVAAQIEWVRAQPDVNKGDGRLSASSGNSSSAASSGDYSSAASSGNSSSAASSGYSSRAASSGDYSSAASSGNYSRAASSGNSSRAASSGEKTIAMVAGYAGSAKAGADGCIALAWNDGKRPRITVGYVGEDGLEADTWYRCDDAGKLVRT